MDVPPDTPPPPIEQRRWGFGTVHQLYTERRFGFIRCISGPEGDVGQNFFFHASALVDCTLEDLQIGTSVRFDGFMTPKGRRAERVQRSHEG